MADEFRVVWKREGRRRSTRIYQSWSAAYHKAQGILALDAVKADTTYETLPDLEEDPIIEQRTVGPWESRECVITAPSEWKLNDMRALYGKPISVEAEGFPW